MTERLSADAILSVVIPVYNEEAVLEALFERLDGLAARLPISAEFVMVDDGSSDRSLVMLLDKAAIDVRYRVVELSRNFGHQKAVSAGLELARGDAVVLIDADLQDPPELIELMLERWRDGVDVVYGQRRTRQGETWFKLASASAFYRVLSWSAKADIPENTGDFRLMDRAVVEAFNRMPEHHRFIRGMVAWLGFRQEALLYDRQSRVAGESKYPLKKMISLSLDALFSFSMRPLRAVTLFGVFMTVLAFILGLFLVVAKLIEPGYIIPGFTTTWTMILCLFGINFTFLGVLGEYIGRTYVNVQGRPNYVIRRVVSGPSAEPSATEISKSDRAI